MARKRDSGPNSKAVVAILIVCFVLFAAATKHALKPGNRQMRGTKKSPVYRLNVERPMEFLKQHLPAALVKPQGRLFGDDAIDIVAPVHISRATQSVEMEVELLSGCEMNVNKYYVRLAGTPATLDETYALALRLCDLAQISNDRIVDWYKDRTHGSSVTSADLQAGTSGHNRHEIEVRSSLQPKGDTPWRVIYTIYFSRDEGAQGDEHSEKDRVD